MSLDKRKKYLIGVGWFLLSLICSVNNDIITKHYGLRLPIIEVAFFKFLFSILTLIPFILYYGKDSLKSSRPGVQFMRGLLLFISMTSWIYGLSRAPVTTATVISFTIPLFVLILAVFTLKEKIIWQRWAATIIGFIGIVIIVGPHSTEFNPNVLYFVLAATMFAMLDIINKKFVVQETMIAMLFYSVLLPTILAGIPTYYYWQTPELQDYFMLLILGGSSNLILFFILKAFRLADATALAPYRYLELLLSAGAAFIVFGEVPNTTLWLGAAVIIPTTLFVVYSESMASKRKKKSE